MTWGYISEEDTGTIHPLSNHLKIAGMQWNLPVLGIHTGPFFPSFYLYTPANSYLASQVALGVKNLPADAGDIRDTGSVPGLGRSPGVEHGNTLQYTCLENPMDRGAWRVTVHSTTHILRHRFTLNCNPRHPKLLSCIPTCYLVTYGREIRWIRKQNLWNCS